MVTVMESEGDGAMVKVGSVSVADGVSRNVAVNDGSSDAVGSESVGEGVTESESDRDGDAVGTSEKVPNDRESEAVTLFDAECGPIDAVAERLRAA